MDGHGFLKYLKHKHGQKLSVREIKKMVNRKNYDEWEMEIWAAEQEAFFKLLAKPSREAYLTIHAKVLESNT